MKKAGFITIIGRPNAGKSTLLNAILQTELSIVTPKAQTTRERVLGIYSEPEGQIVFLDTPGVHRAREGGLNHYMMNEAKEAIDSSHLIWYIVDPESALKHESAVLNLLERVEVPVFILMNKIDQVKKANEGLVATFMKELVDGLNERKIPLAKSYQISALKGQGIAELVQASWQLIPEGSPYYPDPEQASDRPTRFFVAEKIRERLYYCLGEEVPYSCAVEIEKYEEDPKLPRIEAIIHVERDSQKGIVIGQKGSKIKEIGQSARQEIEAFLGQKVFLGLRVKVLKDWSQNAEALKRMGYALPHSKRKS